MVVKVKALLPKPADPPATGQQLISAPSLVYLGSRAFLCRSQSPRVSLGKVGAYKDGRDNGLRAGQALAIFLQHLRSKPLETNLQIWQA